MNERARLAHRILRGTLNRAVAKDRVPGLAVAVFDARRTQAVETAGLADMAARRAVRPSDMFEIGSIGKTFTALVVMQLVEEGRVGVDDPIARHLPWFEVPIVDRAITIHDLLTHTAGITSGTDGTPEAAFQVWALRDLVPGSAPGIRHHYSNVGYKALGLMIEAVDGRRYPEAVRTRILEPLGMSATEPEIRHPMRRRLAVGYEYLFDDRIGYAGQPLAPATWLETDTADGSLASTAADMARFGRMLLRRGATPRGRLVSDSSFEAMSAPHAAPRPDYAYGYGLFTRHLGGRTYLGHGGGMVGYQAGLQVEPASGLGAVVLQSGPGINPMDLARTAIAIFRDGREPAAVGDSTADRDIVGTYVPDDRTRTPPIEVAEVGGTLVLRGEGTHTQLEDWGDRRYLAHDPILDRHLLSFGPAEGAALEMWHGEARYVRDGAPMPAAPVADAGLRSCAGRYRSYSPWTTNFRVLLRGDRLWLTFSVAPDGFDDEQPLVDLGGGAFRVGEDEAGPERLVFDAVVEGRALRATLSGFPFYRAG